jgi:DNA-directed RNA polymerase alpha subunit/DNA-directed RNA polymerase subunit L
MNPSVELTKETKVNKHSDECLYFTLSGVNVSIANAVRRTMISDIPIAVFRTTPYEENKANIIYNTTRLNNEIIKQRLSCIPIHIKDPKNVPLKNYLLEVNVENKTDETIYVTTKDFVIKDLTTNQSLSEKTIREIFPPFNSAKGDYYIDFVRLRPKLSDELPGEKIHLTCEFGIGTAKENGMFNVVSTCSYGFTPDDTEVDIVLAKLIQGWKADGKTEAEIDFDSKNWMLLDAKRITKSDSFDFVIQSVGIYTNEELLAIACDILENRIDDLLNIVEKDELAIIKSQNTMMNSFDIILVNEDYTIGKVLEFMLYSKFYENMKLLTFCGFKKMHPHDSDSIIRIAYAEPVDKSIIKGHLIECLNESKQVFKKMGKEFLKFVKN